MKIKLCHGNKDRQESWTRWFAWRPVLAESANDSSACIFIWMDWVERKEAIGYSGFIWRHREIV